MDRVSTGSGSDLVSDKHTNLLIILTFTVDQVATAPCTDPILDELRLLRQGQSQVGHDGRRNGELSRTKSGKATKHGLLGEVIRAFVLVPGLFE